MSELILHGRVHKKPSDTITVSASFEKRELIIATEEQYPQYILINFTQGKCDSTLDSLQVGQLISVSINVRGREWTNPQGEVKYFNDIQGWKIAINTTEGAAPQTAQTPPPPTKQAAPIYTHTATDATEAAYRTAGWSTDQLVANKKGFIAPATQSPAPPPKPQQTTANFTPDPNFKEEEHDDLPF
jgi:hypothetical protein